MAVQDRLQFCFEEGEEKRMPTEKQSADNTRVLFERRYMNSFAFACLAAVPLFEDAAKRDPEKR